MLGLRSLLRFSSRWRNKLLYGQVFIRSAAFLTRYSCYSAELLCWYEYEHGYVLFNCIDSKLTDLVKKYEVGKCFSRNDLSGMVEFVTELQSNTDYHFRLKINTIKATGDFTEENAMRFVADVR